MAGTYIPWVPVRNYGCGWADCPTCGPMIELEIEAEHRRKVQATYPKFTSAEQLSEWFGEIHGTGGARAPATSGRSPITKAERALALAARRQGRGTARVVRTLPPADRDLAEAILEDCKVRRAYLRRTTTGKLTRKEWLTEVWLEILNPSALIGTRERGLDIEQKVARAIQRAEGQMRAEQKTDARDHAAAMEGTTA